MTASVELLRSTLAVRPRPADDIVPTETAIVVLAVALPSLRKIEVVFALNTDVPLNSVLCPIESISD